MLLLSKAIDDGPQALREDLRHWWMSHRDDLATVAVEQVPASAVDFLRRGETTEARLEIAAHMDRDAWRAYRDGTTEALAGEVVSHMRLMSALRGLGRVGAMALGSIIAGASRGRAGE